MNLPSLSIVVTCFNLEKFIEEALQSVFLQDYKGQMQLIIIDDCSSDHSCDKIRETISRYGEGWDILFHKNEKNLGIAATTDVAWSLAKYDWMVMVDGDDVQFPERCSLSAEAISRHPDAGMIMFSVRNIDEHGTPSGYRSYGKASYETAEYETVLRTPQERADCWLGRGKGTVICCYGCAAVFNRKVYEKWGPLIGEKEGAIRCAQDPTWEFRTVLCSPIVGVNEVVCAYRSHSGNLYNRSMCGDVEGYKEMELFWAHNQRMPRFNAKIMLRDLSRAECTPGLTDWDEQSINAARQKLHTSINSCELRIDWWDINWFQRVARAFRFKNKISPNFKYWAWVRLLPLSIVARLRRRKHEH